MKTACHVPIDVVTRYCTVHRVHRVYKDGSHGDEETEKVSPYEKRGDGYTYLMFVWLTPLFLSFGSRDFSAFSNK